jgi:hypothetical protein
MKTIRTPHATPARGVVMVFVLITLIIMLLGAVAIMRSVDSTMYAAGNVAFKRDLMNQAEQVASRVTDALLTGGLNTPALRAANVKGLNYSATILPTNSQGIPTALLDNDNVFNGYDFASTANDLQINNRAVTIRYVIDRLCSETGDEAALGADKCITGSPPPPLGGSWSEMQNAQFSTGGAGGGTGASAVQVVYRVSVRVTGPRDTQAFYQTTFTL